MPHIYDISMIKFGENVDLRFQQFFLFLVVILNLLLYQYLLGLVWLCDLSSYGSKWKLVIVHLDHETTIHLHSRFYY